MFRLGRKSEQPSEGPPGRATAGDRNVRLLAALDDDQTLELAVDAYWRLLQSMLPSEDEDRNMSSFLNLN